MRSNLLQLTIDSGNVNFCGSRGMERREVAPPLRALRRRRHSIPMIRSTRIPSEKALRLLTP